MNCMSVPRVYREPPGHLKSSYGTMATQRHRECVLYTHLLLHALAEGGGRDVHEAVDAAGDAALVGQIPGARSHMFSAGDNVALLRFDTNDVCVMDALDGVRRTVCW